MQGKVLVFAANAVIFLLLALLGFLLGLFLLDQAASCDADDPDAVCERSLATGRSALGVSGGLAVGAVLLAIVAWALHRRAQRSVQ